MSTAPVLNASPVSGVDARHLPAAVLWDMDGTLVDTEQYWIATEFEIVEAHGGTWSLEHAHHLVGNALIDSARYIAEHGPVPLPAEQIVELLLDGVVDKLRQGIPWRPGARELLGSLADAGVPCGLVTMSYQRFVDPILEVLGGHGFDVVVTGDAVKHGKPHPEPYLVAAAQLGLEPAECLAIEDSGTGTRSAQDAGCAVLVVPLHVPVEQGERRIFRDTLDGIDAAEAGRIHREAFAGRG
ncbi:HAD family hydrolase [Nocardioides yefusunii]|uniref:HAD family hydrolase n=1 Tax=Nocardioides yefusunii TaxID=2500546 RepID=A0ABW1QSM3_9ACTN|nr:HAD family hydrolase [Nocardioides yefusunii]